jgi:hypothetical protein
VIPRCETGLRLMDIDTAMPPPTSLLETVGIPQSSCQVSLTLDSLPTPFIIHMLSVPTPTLSFYPSAFICILSPRYRAFICPQ